jgi:hypothetical protein
MGGNNSVTHIEKGTQPKTWLYISMPLVPDSNLVKILGNPWTVKTGEGSLLPKSQFSRDTTGRNFLTSHHQ